MLLGQGITKEALVAQRAELQAQIHEAQEDALRQLAEAKELVHEQVDVAKHEAQETLEVAADAVLSEAAVAAAEGADRAEARLLERATGARIERYSGAATDAFHTAALESAEQHKQGVARTGDFWSHEQFGRDADGNPVAGKESSFNASREARKATAPRGDSASPAPSSQQKKSSGRDVKATVADAFHTAALESAEQHKQGVARTGDFWSHEQFGRDADGNPVAGKESSFNASREARKATAPRGDSASPAPSSQQKKSSGRDVKAARERERTAKQTAATQMPAMAMSAEQRSQLASAVIHMNMQAHTPGAAAEGAVQQQVGRVQPPAAPASGGLIGYMASYPLRNAQTKKQKANKQQAKRQSKMSMTSGTRTLQQKASGLHVQMSALGTPPRGTGATRQQNPMLSSPLMSMSLSPPGGDDDDDMGID
jgi:hypothetical protein